MSESELLKRIAELEARNLELLTENDKLREMLGLPQKNQQDAVTYFFLFLQFLYIFAMYFGRKQT